MIYQNTQLLRILILFCHIKHSTMRAGSITVQVCSF